MLLDAAETSSNTQFAFRRLWKKYGVQRRQHNLSRGFVFMTVGDADTPCHPQFFRVLRETLENLGCSLSAERDTLRMLPIECLVAATGHILGGCDGHQSPTLYC